LGIAINHGDREAIETLLDYGADPNQRWCVTIDPEPTKRIRDPNCVESNGITPLMFATARHRPDLVQALRQHGAN
jgi:ankyrin repeat protein